ncbi:MAG: penicillin acylase family protein [Tumebacillaceae bacterium]
MANKRVFKWVNLCLSVIVGGGLIYGLSNSIGPVPALAPTFNTGTGVWTTAKAEVTPHTEDLTIAGLDKKVKIVFEKDGTSHIQAETDHDAWVAVGYLHAKYRLLQMDLERRQGRGLLAEVVGNAAVDSDKFQRQLGLDRTAQAEWDMMKPDDELRKTLEAYTVGINQVIDEETQSDTLPMMFKILGYKPQKWTPQDTLVIQGVLTQMLSLGSAQVSYSLLADHIGYDHAMSLWPVLPYTKQVPYDNGPYKHNPLMDIPMSAEVALQQQQASASLNKLSGTLTASAEPVSLSNLAASSVNVSELIDTLPTSQAHQFLNSNAWAVDGTKTESGKPLMAGDPHLEMTLPSTWYQMQVDAPNYHFHGVAVPGVPAILIGRNQDMSWTMTNGSNQQAFYYDEKTDAAHPNQYFYKGEWHKMTVTHQEIPVKGGKSVPVDIQSTVHGPLVTLEGKTFALDWVGAIPSMSLKAMLNVSKVKNYEEFKGALNEWRSPTMNFVYADKKDIGLYGAGLYAVLGKDSKPWMPLRGTGEDDITGAIPYTDIPQTYNPPSHMISTGNQREVRKDYPYYVGTTLMFEPSYRAGRIWDMLAAKDKLSEKDFETIQNDTHDILASRIVPVMLKNLSDAGLSDEEKQALSQLSSWDYDMKTDQVAPTLWWTFWEKYIKDTVEPWYTNGKMPQKFIDRISANTMATDQSLESWTLSDPNNDFFNNPITKEKRDSKKVMVQAFHDTVTLLKGKLGTDMTKWTWDRVHTRVITSLTQLPALSYGPKPLGGDSFTVNVGTDWKSDHGPSWRMIVDWGTEQAVGIYPGGQSENPLSPWYEDRMDDFWTGKYRPLQSFADADADKDNVRWNLVPSGK